VNVTAYSMTMVFIVTWFADTDEIVHGVLAAVFSVLDMVSNAGWPDATHGTDWVTMQDFSAQLPP